MSSGMADQAGDYLNESKSCDFRNKTDARNYEFSYLSPMEAQIRKWRQSLDDWKEIALQAKSVFLWEKHWHPTALIGGSTTFFMLLWLVDPPILTVFALLLITGVLADYLIPTIAASLFKPENWTVQREKEFEDLCTSLVLYKAKAGLAWVSYHKMKTTNRKLYFLMTITSLSVLAWIGNTVNNLFLTYVLITFLLLLPGMEYTGIISKWSHYIQGFLSEFIKHARTKVGQEKKDN